MQYNKNPEINRKTYEQMLVSAGAISNLFSANESPYLVSRNVENAYCLALGAENLGRADCSADASIDNIGIGIKTFIDGNQQSLQKVAEFNKDSLLYRGKNEREMVKIISELRNNRLDFTKRTYGLETMIYHCVTRSPGKIYIFETPMDNIQTDDIKQITVKNNTITFLDGINEYSFNLTKSTLYKRFYTKNILAELDVKIIENPYLELIKLFSDSSDIKETVVPNNVVDNFSDLENNIPSKDYRENLPHVILPLFSDRGARRHVPEKSGLNQWNANGRTRNPNEVYIPIPSLIHLKVPNFFPSRDQDFQLQLPNKSILSSKVCQENSKALMSNPNSALGEWLLRTVFDLEHEVLLKYDRLEELGIDSVKVYKHSDRFFSIDFCEIGSYDDFKTNYLS